MDIEIVTVADSPRLSLGVALNILIARKVYPELKFNVAIPADSLIGSAIAEKIIREFSETVYEIPAPSMVIEQNAYRIENKLNALRYFGPRPAILVDSDVFFIKRLPLEFLVRAIPAAVPEHSPLDLPWPRIYETLNLKYPILKVICGGGSVSEPWFNAGFVTCRNAEQLGQIWWMLAQFISKIDWIPKRFPYTDQISLPLAIAQLTESRTVEDCSVLPSRFNQNMFYWAGDQGFLTNGFVAHHHNRVGLIRKFFPRIIMWISDGFPEIEGILSEMSVFDKD